MADAALQLNPVLRSDAPVSCVLGLEAHAGFYGQHAMVYVDFSVHHDRTLRFAIAPCYAERLVRDLTAAARITGRYREATPEDLAAEMPARPVAAINGHTKQLPIIEYTGGFRPVSRAIEEAQLSALDDVADDRGRMTDDGRQTADSRDASLAGDGGRATELGTDLATRNRIADSAAFAEAWRLYSTGEGTLAECGVLLELTAEGMRQCFLRHKATDYHRAAKLWQRFHFRTRPERIRLFAQAASAA